MNEPEKIELPARRFAGLATRITNSQVDLIQDHWNRFSMDQTLGRTPGRLGTGMVAVYCDYESDYTGEYTLLLGYEVAADAVVPAGLRVVASPAQKYAVLLAQGEQPQAVQQAWQWVWASALDRTYTVDFDEYIGPGDVRLHVGIR